MATLDIDKKTSISIGLLIVLMPIIVATVSWGTRVNAQVSELQSDNQTLSSKIDELNQNLTTTNQNVVELTTKINIYLDQSK